ncbi:MAG: toxin-antitoxin system HicB family antitoxin [Calditrichia bacterium]
MSAMSIRIPDELKEKAMRLAKKNNISFNSLVNHWLRTAVMQDETIAWMNRRLQGKDSTELIEQFGKVLSETTEGNEPTLQEINKALKK